MARNPDAYLGTLARMEEVALVDRDASLASIAISLKRIADAIEGDPMKMDLLDRLEHILQGAALAFRQ